MPFTSRKRASRRPGGDHCEAPRAFISYRRRDSSAAARWLAETIENTFGPRSVFIDTESIRGGEKFPAVLDGALDAATAMLVVIGPDWLRLSGDRDQPLLEDPRDWVHLEVARGLRRGIPIIPVCVAGASIPKSQ